jgi:hypothetical protein
MLTQETVHFENSIQRFPVKRHILPGRLLNPASSSLPHVADFNGIRHRWRFGWASWAIQGPFKKLTNRGDAS